MDTVATEDHAASSPAVEASTTSNVSSPSSQTKGEVLVPATTSGRRSTASKVLRFSDIHIPAPDFNAALSSPPTVPTSILKSVLVKKLPKPPPSIQESSPCVSATVATKKLAAVKADDVLDDLIPASSSPTPNPKKSIKVGMRKNDHTAAHPPLIKPVKRKAVVDSDSDSDVPLASRKRTAGRPTKRARSSPVKSPVAPQASIPKESPPKQRTDHDSLALRPPAHARRRYHARKGRTSSPQLASGDSSGPVPAPIGNFVDVDYDELPTSPPRRAVASGAAGKSSSAARTTNVELGKKAAKANKDLVEGEQVEKAENATNQTTLKKAAKLGKTVKAEKANMATKTEKVAKAGAAKTSPEGSALPMKLEKPRAGATAQKNDVPSNASAKTKTKTKTQKPGNSTKGGELAIDDGLRGDVAANGPPRVPPRPRRAGAGATKTKEKDVAKPAIVTATESDLVPGYPPPQKVKAQPYEGNTHIASVDIHDTVDAAIVATDCRTSSDIIDFTFLDDVQPPQPEIVFSDPSIVDNSTEVARSSSRKSAASKPGAPKSRSAKTPWDAMAQAQSPQEPQRSGPNSLPDAGVVTVLAQGQSEAPAGGTSAPVESPTGTCSTNAKIAVSSVVGACAGKKEAAVQALRYLRRYKFNNSPSSLT
uniref:Zn(2)-C6 fungal-type domain-containing protein n=1 Tax=Ganoderma boninense TaxID=34458 RepID=A0A5K1JVW3_9APHY|nr:Zn(2)-C6 fungal-type domain-containing protein [Ganoderma boninense]